MDRPVSAASSANAATTATITTTTTGHKRQPSVKNGLTPTGTTIVSLFVTNLRLLDLDLEPDWPHITVQSFSNQDARTKIRSTEYALYHLFRLYDPSTTTEKLQPFFPPLEPLQSVNLRAALYRCLNDLKKSGVLAREAVLRKTMLDECQGDRFWEVCLSFSAAVLRKQMLENQSKYGGSIAYRLGTASAMTKKEKESMLPLAIAHKSALNRVLKEKQKRWETYTKLYDLLVQKETELQERKIVAEKELPSTFSQEQLSSVELAVEKSWIGDNDLKQALIGGDVCADGDGMLLRSFDDLWKANGIDTESILSDGSAGKGFLQNLRDNVQEQSRRLRKWQTFHEKLMASKPRSTQSSNRSSASVRSTVRFDRHRELKIREPSPQRDQENRQTHERHDSVLRYDEILTAMRDELRKNVANQGGPTPAVPAIPPMRRAQTQPLVSHNKRASVVLDPPSTTATTNQHHHHQRSPSQTAVPMWSRMGTRTPSRSKSYQQPKVKSQREPIPLKSEIFSPLKDRRRSSAGSSSILASPDERRESINTITPSERTKSVTFDDPRRDSGVPDKASDAGLGISSNGTFSTSSISESQPRSAFSGLDDTPSQPPRPGIDRIATAPASIARPSLAERTRMSMVFNNNSPGRNAVDQAGGLTSPDATPKPSSSSSSSSSENKIQDSALKPFSLAERTRESISFAPQHPSSRSEGFKAHLAKKKVSYPVNQFETPPKQRSRNLALETGDRSLPPASSEDSAQDLAGDGYSGDGTDDQTPVQTPQKTMTTIEGKGISAGGAGGRRDVTPLEQLLSPEADYDSVFKSRPRVVHSPRSETPVEVVEPMS